MTGQILEFPDYNRVEVGVDWLTCTQIRGARVNALLRAAKNIVADEAQQGCERTSWRGQGYHGERAGGASWGIRADTYLCTLSSGTANEHWAEISKWATNCSRLDLQATFHLTAPAPHFFDKLENHLLRTNFGKGQRPEITRLRSSKGGNTVYIGKRTSDQLYRWYDKGVESKSAEPNRIIRFEAEFKRKLALGTLLKISQNPSDKSVIGGIIYNTILKQSIGIRESFHGQLEVARVERVSSYDKKLQYLANCIRPMVDDLRKAGLEENARAILFPNPMGGDFS